VPLFKANVVKNATTAEVVMKNYKHFGIVQKLVSRDNSTGKNEVKAVKLNFKNEADSLIFKDRIKLTMEILEKNDLALLEENNTQGKEERATDNLNSNSNENVSNKQTEKNFREADRQSEKKSENVAQEQEVVNINSTNK